MFILLGIRVSHIPVAAPAYVCDRCGQHAVHQVTKRVRKLTVFFVPLVAVGTKYLDTCGACGRTVEVPRRRALAAG